MDDIAKISKNGSGDASVSGRGLARRKLTLDEQIKLAADLATGERPFKPSFGQAADLVGVTVAQIRAELKARAVALKAEEERRLQEAAVYERWLDDIGHAQPAAAALLTKVPAPEAAKLRRDAERNHQCSICGHEYDGCGNNAAPINRGRCCDQCNARIVIRERFRRIFEADRVG
jgi:DNA-directed RNA polymerase subunit RPC12/RpoP